MRLTSHTPGDAQHQRGLQDEFERLAPESGREDRASGQPNRETMVAHNLDGLLVQRNDAFRMLIINDSWVRLSQLEYLVLLPLLEHFKDCVSSDTLLQVAYGCSYEPREARRLARVIYRLRPKLAPHDLAIDTVIGTSFRQWGYMLQRATPWGFMQQTSLRPLYPC